MKKLILSVITMVGLVSCNNKIETKPNEQNVLVGKKGLLTYPEFKAEVSYLTDSTLHWKTTANNGEIAEGTEKIFAKKLNENQYFLNWIEKDGTSISQIIDLKEKKVTIFGTFEDENSERGKRGSMNIEGNFEFIK